MVMFFFFFINFIFSGDDTPNDPEYKNQFPLHNIGQFFGINSEDIKFQQIYKSKYFGKNVNVNVIDNGCIHHDDLGDNFDLEHSWNYETNSQDPTPTNLSIDGANHGTTLAGIISARADNNLCTVGVAPESKVSCFSVYNSKYSRVNFLNALQKNNEYYHIKLIGANNNIICNGYQEDDQEVNYIINSAPEKMNFVISVEGKSGADSNDAAIARNPRVIVVSESNNRGARSAWSSYGSNILVNSPVGGSSSYDNDMFPTPPGLGVSAKDTCLEAIGDPKGTSAAYVSGAIAMMLGIQPNLTWREVQAVLIMTATKNDPQHHSWSTNGMIPYSNVFGYGRIDLSKIKETLTTGSPFKLPKQMSEVFENSAEFKIPSMRNGAKEFYLNVNSKIVFVEFIELSVTVTCAQPSLLRIFITSPKQNSEEVKAYSNSYGENQTTKQTFKYLIRSFFFENPNGEWRVKMIYDSPTTDAIVHHVAINISGCSEQPRISFFPSKDGANPYARPDNESKIVNIEIGPNDKMNNVLDIECGKAYEISLSIQTENNENIELGIFLSDKERTNRWPVGKTRRANTTTSFSVPCLFVDKLPLYLIAENRKEEAYGEISIVVSHNYIDPSFTYNFIEKPEKYDLLDINKNIEIVPSMHLPYWVDGSSAQKGRVIFYDMDNKTIKFQKEISFFESISFPYFGEKCKKCILALIPAWSTATHNNYNSYLTDCVTMLQPVTVQDPIKDDRPDTMWPIPLNDNCPIPPGVFTPGPELPTKSPTPTDPANNAKLNMRGLIVGSGFLASFAVFLVVFFWCNRSSKEFGQIQTFSIMDSESLILN